MHQLYKDTSDIYDHRGGYMHNRGTRLKEWKDAKGKGKFPHLEWVQNSDRYDLKINNEHVNYMDVFNPDYLIPTPAQCLRGCFLPMFSSILPTFVYLLLEVE